MRKRRRHFPLSRAVLLTAAFLVPTAFAQTAPATNALPYGGQVAAGRVNLTQAGAPNAPTLTVTQSSDRAIVNWAGFDVGRDASVRFVQPSAASAILNRVVGADPSRIYGQLQANGQVFLVNPNGVYFSPTSSVDVGAFVASTLAIADADFMAGRLSFRRDGATGTIVNEGAIRSSLGGYVALLAPEVRNSGLIMAEAGSVLLAAGEAVSFNFDPVAGVTGLLVEPARVQALVDNGRIVRAPGGQIVVSAQAHNEMAAGVIRNTGELAANGITTDGGRVMLGASDAVEQGGLVDASSAAGMGGSIAVAAPTIALLDASSLLTTGALGGGRIHVGGGWQGSGALPRSRLVTQAANSLVDASAVRLGAGGEVVLWSDVHDTLSLTQAAGVIRARGGELGGDGGRVETSGYTLRTDGLSVDTRAPGGRTGLWLLDPVDITIAASGGNLTPTQLRDGLLTSNVTISTAGSGSATGVSPSYSAGSGNITISNQVESLSPNGLTLTADNNINVNAIIAMGGALTLNATNAINLAANVTTGGDQTYNGAVNLGSAITLSSYGWDVTGYQWLASQGELNARFGGTSVSFRVVGGMGGQGGSDGGSAGQAGGASGDYTANVALSGVTDAIIHAGSGGSAGANSASGSGGGAGGAGRVGYQGGTGGNAGGTGSSGGGGGGGAASVVSILGGTLVGGGGGGGAGGNNVSGDGETPGQGANLQVASGNAGGTGGYGGTPRADGGGSGGGGGGILGGQGGVGADATTETSGRGGYAGTSGASGVTVSGVTQTTYSAGSNGFIAITGRLVASSTPGSVIFNSTVNGAQALTIYASTGTVTFGGNVGVTTPLGALVVEAAGTSFGTGTGTRSVLTGASQTWNSPLSLDSRSLVLETRGSAGSSFVIDLNQGLTKAAGGDITVDLRAHRDIYIGGSFTPATGKVDLKIEADYENNGATVARDGVGFIQVGGSIVTNGGFLKFGSGATATVNGASVLVGGDVYVTGASAATFNTGGGAFEVQGELLIGNASGLSVLTGGGTALFAGSVDAGNTYSSVTGNVTWTTAQTNAASGTPGAVGSTYLATITSRLENMIAIRAANYDTAWLGGRRTVGIGTNQLWRWVTGPEGLLESGNGLRFFTQNTTGSGGVVTTGAYANWNSGEPNNSGGANTDTAGEPYLQFVGVNGVWNDLSTSSTSPNRYVRETLLAASPLTVNAGSGAVTFSAGVGQRKALGNTAVTGGAITFGAATSVGANTLTVTAATSATGTAGALTAASLVLQGAGTHTFTNASNNIGTLAAGTVAQPVGGINYRDADALTVGTVGSVVGIRNGGTVQVTAGGALTIGSAVTTTGGDLLFDAAGDLMLAAVISKTDGAASLLRLRTSGLRLNIASGGIQSTSASGGLNTVLWSDYANANLGGVWLNAPVSTGGGHLWIGGSSTVNGTSTWKGLTVGDGPSIGANGSNWNAIDFLSAVSTAGGDMFLWVGDGYSSGVRAYFANTSSVSTGSGSFTLRSDSVTPQSGFTLPVTTSGTFTWEPSSASFAAAVSPFTGLFSFTGSTVGPVVIGKAGNAAAVTVSATPTIAGSLTVYASDITVSGNVTTSLANAAVVLKATGSVTQNASTTVQTNGGDIVFWADSGGVGSGNRGILISDSSLLDSRTSADRTATTHTTGGGLILLGGGSTTATSAKGTTIPTGYALNYTSVPAGLMVGSYNSAVGHNANVRMYSGGGDVVWRGKSTQNVASLTIGISAFEGVTVNAGTTGDITLDGVAVGNTTAAGMDIHGWRAGTASSSYLTVDGDILFTSSGTGATNNVGTQLGSSAGFPIVLAATGAGTVTIKGLTSGTASDVNITDVQLLSGSGSVSVIVDRSGGKFSQGGTASAKFGQVASSPVTASSASVLLRADVFDVASTNGLAINTTGTVELTSFNATGFTAASSFSRLDVGRSVASTANSIASFIFGKTTNNAAVTVTAGGVNALGPIRFYGSDLTIGAALRTDAASAEILLQGTGFVQTAANLTTTGTNSPIRLLAGGYVNLSAASTLTTSGSNVLVASNTDNTGGGHIYASGNQTIVTSGGTVTLGGGDAAGSGYAEGGSLSVAEGIRFFAALSINTSVKTNGVSTGGGDIVIRGRSFTSANAAWGAFGVGVETTTTLDSGTATIRLDGISRVSSGDSYNMGVRLLGDVTATSASTSATAIYFSGTGGSAGSSYSGGQGLRLTGGGNLLTTTGVGGGIKLSGTPGSQVYAVVFEGGSILSSSGPIELSGTAANSYVFLKNTPTLGFKVGTSVTSSTANILLSFFDADWGGSANPIIATSGSFTFRPSGTSFNRAVAPGWFTLPTTLSALTVGSATNTAYIYANTALTVQGPVTLQGGYVEVSQPISAAGDILLDGDTGAGLAASVWGVYSNATVSTTAASNGNITLTGRGGNAGSNYGVYLNTSGHITAGGSGSISITGIGGANAGAYNHGILLYSNLTTTTGALTLNGTGGGTTGSSTNKGIWISNSPVLKTTTGTLTLIGTGGFGASSEAIYFNDAGAATLGAVGQSGDIIVRGNSFLFGGSNLSVLGTGAFTIEPTGASFTTALSTQKFTLPSTLASVALGKVGNTGDISVANAISTSGAITITGGAVALTGALTSSADNINLTSATLTGVGGISIPSTKLLTITQSGTSTFDGLISGGGGLTKAGAGALSLTANSTFNGATTISAGTLALGTGGANGWLNNTSSIAIDGTLQIFRGADVAISVPLSGAGTLEIKGAYRATFSSNLTTTAQTIASNTTVAEVVRRLAGGMLNGTAIVGAGTVREAGAYQVNFDPVANVATFQFQHYDTAYTKSVLVKLIQNGADVQALVNTASPHINGTAYIVPNVLGQNMATYAGVTYDMALATSTGATGYGVGRVDLTAKTTLSSLGTFSGTLKLSTTTEVGTGTNVYTKNIPGTLELTGGLGSVSSIVNNGLIIVNDSTGLTLNASISGTGDLFKKGSATTTFAQGVSFSGVTVVGAGGLTLQGAYGSASHTILSGATLTLDVASGDRDFAATTFLGTGKLAKTGAGRALWGSFIGTFSLGAGGLIDIQGGTFLGSSSSNEVWTNNYADVNVASGATLAVAEGAMRVDALTGSGSVTIGGAGGTGSLAVGVDNHSAGAYNATAGTATFSGVIADSAVSTPGAFTKLGTGTQLLSGANTYSGATTVSAGTLAVSDAAGLGSAAAGTTVASGASLDLRNALVGAEALTLNGGTLTVSTGISSLAGAVTLGATSTLSVAGTQLTLDGIISGATFGLTKSGAGIAILTAANTFTGPLVVNAGTLRISGAGRLAAGTYVDAITVASGATFDYASSANQILGATGVAAASNTLRGAGSYLFGGTGTLTLRGDFSATGTVEVSQSVTMTGGTNSPNTGLGQTTSIDIKNGGTITLAGTPNSFTGTTTSSVVTIRTGGKLTTDGSSGQTFHLGAITLAGGEIATGAGATTTVWGIYNFDRTITVTEDSTISAQFSAMYQTGGTVYNVAAGKTLTVSGTLSSPSSTADNGLVLNSAVGSTGTMVLSGINTYTGATTITRGTLRIGGAGLIGNGSYSPNISNSGTLEVATSANQTLTGVISGGGAVTQSGSGTTVLTGTQTYTGATTVSAGVLQVGNGGTTGALATTSALSIATGGTLRFYRSDVFPTSIAVANTVSGDGTLEFRSTGGNGAGQFAFTGTNTLSASAVILLNQARLVVDGQAYLSASLPLVRVFSGGQLYVNRTATIANPLELGAGLGWKETDGTQLGVLHVPAWGLAGPVTFSGNVTLTGSSSIAAWANQADVTMSGVIADGGNGYGFTKLGTLKLTLTGANTFTGTTTISAGTVQVGGGGTTGIVGGPIVNNSALSFSRSDDLTFAPAISGTGTLTKLGANTLTLTGASTYAGATTVTAGGLVFRRDTAPSTSGFSGAGAVTLEPTGASFGASLSAGYTFASTLTGLTLGKSGNTAALTIPANVAIAGPISLYGGDITLTGGLAATATGDILLRSSGVLTIAATRSVSTTAGDVTLTAARFVNNSGSAALSAGGTGKTWRVWSTNANPYHVSTGDVIGSLAFDYRQYNATYGTSTVLGTGKGMLYAYAPSLTATFTSTPTKVYDRTDTATVTGAMVTASSGYVGGDTNAVFTVTGATYASRNVGNGQLISFSAAPTVVVQTSSATGSKPAYGYQITGLSSLAGDITPLALTLTGVTAGNKVYDRSVTAAVSGGSVTPLTGDTVTIDASGAAGTFANWNVGTAKTVTVSGYVLGGADAGNYTVAQPSGLVANITARPLAVTGVTAASKVYDRSVAATLSGGTVTALTGDTVSLVATGCAGVFADWNVGTAKAVSVSGYTLSGANAGNYAIVQPNGVTADITALSLAVTGVTAANKVYDRTVTATLSGGAIAPISGDTVTLDTSAAAGSFANWNVGTAKAVTASGYVLTGADAGNYAVAQPTGLTANITALSLAVTGVTAANKVYDRTVSATLSGGAIAPISGDTVTLDTSAATGVFANRNVGSAMTVTASGYVLGGADAGNYAVAQPTGVTADITAKSLTISGLNPTKVYDRSLTASVSGGTVSPISGDTVTIDASGATGTFADWNVGTGKSVTYAGFGLSGSAAGNYVVVQPTGVTGDITALSLAVTGATAANKTYDQQLTASLSGGTIAPISGDTVTLVTSGRVGMFANKNVGTAKSVTVSGYTITGTDAGNYSLVQPTGVTADITALSLAVTGVTAANKTYDRLLTATLSGGAIAPISGDAVTLVTTNRAGVFADKNVGTAKSVTVSGYTISGADAANYALTQPAGVTADIAALSLAVTGATAANKTYDQLLSAAISGGTIAPISGDTVTLVTSGRVGMFADKNVGTGKSVTVSGYTISGTDAANYTLVQPTGVTADVTALSLAVTGATAANKTYDALLAATITGGAIAPIAGDAVNLVTSGRAGVFADKNVGSSKSVTVSGYTITGTDAGNYALAQPTGVTADITALSLAVTGVTAANKTYDRLLTAVVTGGSIAPISGDTVTLVTSGRAGVFGDKNVGTAKSVTVSGYAISGADAANYSLVQPTGVTADITVLSLAVTGATAANKTYDALLAATITGGSVAPISGDTVTLDISGRAGVFADKNVGTAKSVTVSGYTISGADAANYSLVQPTGVTADITALSLAVTGATATNKTYDALLAATITGGSIAPIAGDSVTLVTSGRAGVFGDKNVGTGKSVAVSGYTISGADAANYSLAQPTGVTADIVALSLAVTGATAANKTYDALLTATISGGSVAPITGDTVTLVTSGRAGVFGDKNVGAGKSVTVSGYTISGADAANYALVQPTGVTADITALSLAVTGATAANKTYDRLLTAVVSGGSIAPISGDTVTLDSSGRAGVFADKNVGTAKSVTVNGYTISGADAANYSLVQPTGVTADITSLSLSVTGATAANKTYDQLLAAAISGGSVAPISGDSVTLVTSGRAGVFADKNVGTGKSVTVSGYTLSGADAANYSLVQPTGVTADITTLSLAVTGATAANKTYDQLLTATISGGTIAPISGDTVTLVTSGRTGVFGDKNVGTGKSVTVSGYAIAGADAANYSLVQPTGVTADIAALSLAITGATAGNKTYDALLGAAISGGSISVISGDTVTLDSSGRAGVFADKNVGTAKSVTVSGYAISGADAANYTLVQPTGVTADITALSLAVTGATAANKTYDALLTAAIAGGSVAPIAGDTVTLDSSGRSGVFADKNVGTGKSVTVSGYAISGADASNYSLVQPTGLTADIAALSLAVTGVTAANKTYDQLLTAAVSGGLVSVISGDTVTLDVSGRAGVFGDKNVGTGKSVTVSGYTISGADAANYSLVQPTGVTADITALSLVVTGATAANKTYDAQLAATISGGSVAPISGDTVTLDGSGRSGVFADKNVGVAKSVTVSGYTLSGADAANYSLVQPTGVTADITALSLVVTGVTAANKTYDQQLTAAVAGGSIAPISGDTVTLDSSGRAGVFGDKNVGSGKTVTVSGYAISGADAANYSLVQPTGVTADITQLTLNLTGVTAADKVYDQGVGATLAGGTIAPITGDDVSLVAAARSGSFADKNVGAGKSVTVSGYAISGADAANYSLAQPTGVTASITQLTLDLTGVTAADKVYDQGVAAAVSGGNIAPISGDDVTLDISGRSGAFADKNVGTAKAVTVSGYAISGADAANYALAQPTGVTASITQLTLNLTGVTAAGKTYDAHTDATISGGVIAPISGDAVTLDSSGRTGVFADKNVGTGKSVTVSGYTISGADAANYTLVQPTGVTADITALSLAVTGATAANKTYDALLTAAISGGSVSPIVGDDVTLDGSGRTGVFGDKNVGTGKSVTVSGYAISGADAANYSLVQPTGVTADITALSLAVTGVSAANKVYDRSVTASLSGGFVTVLAGDTVTLDASAAAGVFTNWNVGTGKAVTASGYALTGADAANYSLVQPTGVTADITALSLAVSGVSAANKVYDGSVTAALSGGAVTALAGDTLSLVVSAASGAFSDKNVGAAKVVTAAGYALTGVDAANYVLTQPTGLTADITLRSLAVTGVTVASKVHDGNVTATLVGGTIAAIAGDAVLLDRSYAVGVFADDSVGTSKAVTASGYALTGLDATNYSILQPTGLTGDITAVSGILYPNVTASAPTVLQVSTPTISLPLMARATPAAPTALGVQLSVSVMPIAGNSGNTMPIGKLFTISSEKPVELKSLSVSIVSGFVAGQTSLEIDVPEGLTVTVDNAKGTVVISGNGSSADYQKVLRSLELRTSGDGEAGKLTLRVGVTDASGSTQSSDVELSRGDVAKK